MDGDKTLTMEKFTVEEPEAEQEISARGSMKGENRSLACRLLLTIFAFLPHSCCGLLFGSGGPAFLDLLQLTNSNVEEGSIYFTSQYFGILVAGTGAGPLYDRFSLEPLMLLAVCLSGGINIAIPYCSSSIWVMAAVNGLKGASMTLIFIGSGLVVVRVWNKKEAGSYMQALHFSYSVGGVIAPFIMRPFLAPRLQMVTGNSTVDDGRLGLPNVTAQNVTISEYFGESHVEKGFLIIGLTTISTGLPFLALTIKKYHISQRAPQLDADGSEKNASPVRRRRLTVPLRIAFLIFIALYYIFIVAIETLFQNYTMTFVVKHLEWSKSRGTQISSAFWGAFAFGRFQGIFTARLLTAWKLLALNFLFLSATVVVFVGGGGSSEVVVWICVPVSGVFIGCLFASGVSYTQQRIMTITGKVYGSIMMAATTGATVNPLVLGTLIQNYSPMWFVYLPVIICALCVMMFAVLTVMVSRWGKVADPKDDGLLDKAMSKYLEKWKPSCFGRERGLPDTATQ